MSSPIRGVGATPSAPQTGEAKAHEPSKPQKAALEFEGMLVRELLRASKVAPKAQGVGGMVEDALSQAISAAGGLGIARTLEASMMPKSPGSHDKSLPVKKAP